MNHANVELELHKTSRYLNHLHFNADARARQLRPISLEMGRGERSEPKM